jgi:hypothetical protein
MRRTLKYAAVTKDKENAKDGHLPTASSHSLIFHLGSSSHNQKPALTRGPHIKAVSLNKENMQYLPKGVQTFLQNFVQLTNYLFKMFPFDRSTKIEQLQGNG